MRHDWQDIGTLTDGVSAKRPPAFYRHYDTMVTIGGRALRAVVIHSSAYDKRRNKRINRILKNSRDKLDKQIKESIPQPFKCLPDAEAAAKFLIRSAGKDLHRIFVDIIEEPKYRRGRPKNGEPRQPTHIEDDLNITIEEDPEKIEKLRL